MDTNCGKYHKSTTMFLKFVSNLCYIISLWPCICIDIHALALFWKEGLVCDWYHLATITCISQTLFLPLCSTLSSFSVQFWNKVLQKIMTSISDKFIYKQNILFKLLPMVSYMKSIFKFLPPLLLDLSTFSLYSMQRWFFSALKHSSKY